ncbi:MAG: hemolysin activation protein [Bacteroidales bacterium]|nr:hemolysin activation protein [Bacteroidales bacterium]
MNNEYFEIPIGILFFNRPWTLEKVFETVRKIKPAKLYLYQDGAREGNEQDVENVNLCRNIVDNVDWECEVHKFYQDKNVGVDPSEFIAIKWIFDKEEIAIFLEDDDVPSESFYYYCRELLYKYKYDQRFNIICGLNQMGEYKNGSDEDYVFTSSGSITGWASWKHVIDSWDENYSFLTDKNALKNIENKLGKKRFKTWLTICENHKASGKEHYESIMGAATLLNNRMNIAPKLNLISNIGIGANSSHGTNNLNTLPKGIKRIFFQTPHELNFPLIHPKHIIEEIGYSEAVDRIMANGYPLVKLYRFCESVTLRIIHGDFKSLIKGLKRRLHI